MRRGGGNERGSVGRMGSRMGGQDGLVGGLGSWWCRIVDEGGLILKEEWAGEVDHERRYGLPRWFCDGFIRGFIAYADIMRVV